MNDSEAWKDIAGYEGLYKVSDKGNIYSVERKDTIGRKIGGRTLKPKYDKDGYSQINLYKNRKSKTQKIHRLVAEAFIPNPNGLPQVNHRDEVKDNNNVENLEWCTNEYNINFGTAIERITQKLSKKVKAINVETNEVTTFSSTREAGRKGYDQGNVTKACRGVYYGGNLYKGYRWRYEEEKS